MTAKPILEIPPFPGARPGQFATPAGSGTRTATDPAILLEALAHHRVGGCYWGQQPARPPAGYMLDGTKNPSAGALIWQAGDDPWHLLPGAASVRLPDGDARALLVLAADRPLIIVSADQTEREADRIDAAHSVKQHLASWEWISPYNGQAISTLAAIELCGIWRALIDANRTIGSVMGIAYWKKPTVTALLWAGEPVPYDRPLGAMPKGKAVAIWRSRLSAAQRGDIAATDPAIAEIEDGFIRSVGLGADCVPPLSIIVDPRGVHFDPNAPSEIEDFLQKGVFSEDLIVRARALRNAIIAGGLSKYESGAPAQIARPGGARRHVLVPGQVEDDRAVISGGALPSNLELLRRARAEAGTDAFLIYKPHPDVLAGHRRGAISEADMAALADHVEIAQPMADLIAMVDELHVNTSLAGFEALLRGKQVTVHGVPFYSGWGLTIDRGRVPERRTALRTLDELVAAALLVYPRYLDPQTGLPCAAEILVDRLAVGAPALDRTARAVIAVRRAAGIFNRALKG